MLQTNTLVVDFVNVIGVGLILLWVYFHSQVKRATKSSIEREWRQKSSAVLVGFAFYAVLMATWGPSGTWVATIGESINTNIQQFATELVIVGEQTGQGSGGDRVIGAVKTIGLFTYIALFAGISMSNSMIKKIASTIKSFP